jgi:hypothetical protein
MLMLFGGCASNPLMRAPCDGKLVAINSLAQDTSHER